VGNGVSGVVRLMVTAKDSLDLSEDRGALIVKFQAMPEEIPFVPEDGGITALRNVGSHSPSNTVSHPTITAVRTSRATLVLNSLIMLFQVQRLIVRED